MPSPRRALRTLGVGLAACACAGLLVALVAALTPWEWGAVAFVLGAALVVAAAALLRTGGQRKTVTVRAPDGTPLRKEPVDPERREKEIRVGLFLFLLGLALWTPLALRAWLR